MDINSIKARNVILHVIIGGHNATDYIKPALLDFSFIDNAKGKADEISLTLADPDGKWSGAWKINKGMELVASLKCFNWCEPDKHIFLPMGHFTVDTIGLSGPPDKISIKAVSAAKTSHISEEQNTKGWEDFTLKGIATELAEKHGLKLMYNAPDHPFQRQDQREESDLAFLHRLCKSCSVNLKIHDGKMIFYDAKKGDAQNPSLSIKKKGEQFSPTSYSFSESSNGTFAKAEVNYHNPTKNENYTAVVSPEGPPPSGQTLKLNKRVESSAAAIALGESALREKNESAETANISVMGHPSLVAGITINIQGFGSYDGIYFVEKAEHKIGTGYTTSAELRKTLRY